MKRKNYSAEFKKQALSKVHQRDTKTLSGILRELNLPLGTLKTWLKESDNLQSLSLSSDKAGFPWGIAQRLAAQWADENQTHQAWIG